MSTWHQRMLPYPLLAPWTDDYVDCSFELEVPTAGLNNGKWVSIKLQFRLRSDGLESLVADSKAQYAVEVSCPKTLVRSTHTLSEDDELILEAEDFSQELSLTPYLVSSDPLESFNCKEHAHEWAFHRPDGFSVPRAGILAVGQTIRVLLEDTSLTSVVDLVVNPNVPDGTFHVQLDDERIKIHVPNMEKEKIESVRRRRGAEVEFAAMFPSLYLHAITEALRNLNEYSETRWAFAMRTALENHGHADTDEEILKNDALRYAQELMDQPLGTFLAAALRSDDEE